MTNKTNHNDSIITESEYVKKLEDNYYENIKRTEILKKIAVISFACLIVITTAIFGKSIIDTAKENAERPPFPENPIYLDYYGNITNDSSSCSYIWDSKNNIIFQLRLTDNTTHWYPVKNTNTTWMTRDDLLKQISEN